MLARRRESGSGKRSSPYLGSRFDMGGDEGGCRYTQARFALHEYTAVHTSRGVRHTCRSRELAILRILVLRRCILASSPACSCPRLLGHPSSRVRSRNSLLDHHAIGLYLQSRQGRALSRLHLSEAGLGRDTRRDLLVKVEWTI